MQTAAVLLLGWISAVGAQEVPIQVYPATPFIERSRLGQVLSIDLEPVNTGQHTLQLQAIRAAVRDRNGLISQRLQINDNGSLPSINTVPARSWKPGEEHTIFNPFHTLASDIPIGQIDFELIFRDENGREVTAPVTVRPVTYRQKTRLILPLAARVLVWDGHDFYAHHRRWDFSNPAPKKLGVFTNASRYALDLVVVDADGNTHAGTGKRREDFYSYGATIIAPAAGRIVAMANDASNEPHEPSAEEIKAKPLRAVYGNFVVIDHGNGEFSQMGHMRRGSVKVRIGDFVRRGQPIGQAGASGTSLFPHLHYQLVNRPGLDAEGLPARFDGLVRVLGAERRRENDSPIDTGDIVEEGQ